MLPTFGRFRYQLTLESSGGDTDLVTIEPVTGDEARAIAHGLLALRAGRRATVVCLNPPIPTPSPYTPTSIADKD